MSALGKVHVITGPGKGKTTAAFGLGLRAAGHGLHVCIVQFMKTGETTGEVVAARQLKNLEVQQFGTGKFVREGSVSKEDSRMARKAVDFVKKRLEEGGCDVLILDEVNVAAYFGLVDPDEIITALSTRKPGTEVVLTGRNAPMEFIKIADYVTTMENTKHPMDAGVEPREGIEW